jgi:hypothetical protein
MTRASYPNFLLLKDDIILHEALFTYFDNFVVFSQISLKQA